MKIHPIAYAPKRVNARLTPKIIEFAKQHFFILGLFSATIALTGALTAYHIFVTYIAKQPENQNLNQ